MSDVVFAAPVDDLPRFTFLPVVRVEGFHALDDAGVRVVVDQPVRDCDQVRRVTEAQRVDSLVRQPFDRLLAAV